ncbi:hypothetical protein ACKKBG_A08665 [Auxenochlorella protothecoides x Auxenochlorella symbiontica]
MLLLLSLGVLSRGACTTKFFSLPAVTYGPHVYMLEVSSADDICRWMGYSKSGSIRESNLYILGLPVNALNMSSFEISKDWSTRILVAVECLKAGQKACTADKDGNIGTGNKGKYNFGDNNEGNWNIGSSNKGNLNWGYNNRGTKLRCNNAGLQPTAAFTHQECVPSLPLSSSLSSFPVPSFPVPSFPISSSLSSSALSSSALSSSSLSSSALSSSALSFSALPSAFSFALPSALPSALSATSTDSACPSSTGRLQ